MTRVLIGNDFSEDARTDRGWTGWWVQRLAWFAREGDVLVLPVAPEADFLAYVTALTGVPAGSLRAVVPPPGATGTGTLSPDRLADPVFLRELREAIGTRRVTEVFPLWPDVPVARLVRELGIAAALPGYGFVDQAGGLLLNSKSAFRAIAGGAGVPVPQGTVGTSAEAVEPTVLELLALGHPAIVKHDFLSGGHGNEILNSSGPVRPVGARRVVEVRDRDEVRAYLADRWEWLTGGGRSRPVVERYYRDSSAYFAEFLISDAGIRLTGTGELLSAPYAVGQIMPAVGLEPHTFQRLVELGRRLCEPLHALGYRGTLGADAIVTPDGEVLFTEYNGRVTGSTHIYGVIGEQVVGPGYGEDRVILERVWPEGWSVPSFAAAVERLAATGTGWNPGTRTGVVLTNAFDGEHGVMYCIVAADLDDAWARDAALKDVFGAPASPAAATTAALPGGRA
ncbi:peptide ligase PGM1-related protein [Kitasatospora sp. NPDC057015]|uniref:preATP grasp domain-containing protein n=1 Tax=Kitasatospora sp. NPDC057015 TaxID=3346001 RepID=UPI0036420FC4